jgi:hypothetical protein
VAGGRLRRVSLLRHGEAPPIRHLERSIKGGLGVMADDVVAAFFTLLVLAIAKRLIG